MAIRVTSERVKSAKRSTVTLDCGRSAFATFPTFELSLAGSTRANVRDVRKANTGAMVLRVDDCNFVTQSEIARKIDRPRQQVHQYITGERGTGGFPPPACHITQKAPLWRWCEVAHWLWQNSIIKENALRDAQMIEAINVVLDFSYQKNLHPDLIDELFTDFSACPAI